MPVMGAGVSSGSCRMVVLLGVVLVVAVPGVF